jgi:hypothetical protein
VLFPKLLQAFESSSSGATHYWPNIFVALCRGLEKHAIGANLTGRVKGNNTVALHEPKEQFFAPLKVKYRIRAFLPLILGEYAKKIQSGL